MARNKVSYQQIGDALGTSKVTVSRALNGQPGVSEDLRQRIREYAAAHGHALSRREEGDVRTLAFFVPQRFFLEFDRFYTVIYFHLNRLCQERGIVLSVITISPEEEQNGVLPASLSQQTFDGLFFVGVCREAILHKVRQQTPALVMIDFKSSDGLSSCVLSDNYALGFEVANYLLDKGHRELGFVGDYRRNVNICDRYMGVRKALTLREIPYTAAYDLVNNDPITGLYTLDFSLPERLPTAYVCFCDMAAHYLYEKLTAAGIRVPEDVSVVSFDNTAICSGMKPALTSMDISMEDFAQLAFARMMKEIASPGGAPRQLFVRSHLVERESVRSL